MRDIEGMAAEAGVSVDLMQRQFDLEVDMHLLGAAQFRKNVTEKMRTGNADWTPGGSGAVKAAVSKLAPVIEAFLKQNIPLLDPVMEIALAARAGRVKLTAAEGKGYQSYLASVGSVEAATICMRVLIAGMAQAMGMGEVRTALVRELEYADKFAALRADDADLEFDIRKQAKRKGKGAAGTARLLDHAIANTVSWEPWEKREKHRMGASLIYAAARCTGLIEIKTVRRKGKTENVIRPSPALESLVNERHIDIAAMSVVLLSLIHI